MGSAALALVKSVDMPEQPSSSKSASDTPAITDAELEKLLSREASAFQRELEVERILLAFKLKCVPGLTAAATSR